MTSINKSARPIEAQAALQPEVGTPLLPRLPVEIMQCVGQFLERPELVRLSSTSRAMRDKILDTPHSSLAEPSRHERTLGARIARQIGAIGNISRGLSHQHRWELPYVRASAHADGPRDLLESSRNGLIPRAIVTHGAGSDVLCADAGGSSAGLGVPGKHRCYTSVPLLPDHSRHAVVVHDHQAGLGVWHTGNAQKSVFYKFKGLDPFGPHHVDVFQLGAEGKTLSRDARSQGNKQFWQLIGNQFVQRDPDRSHARALGMNAYQFAICPSSGRMATIKGKSLLCYSRDLTLCGEVRVNTNANTLLSFSPNGESLLLTGYRGTSFGNGLHFDAVYAVSGSIKEAPKLKLDFIVAKNSMTTTHWHLDRQGKWHLKTFEQRSDGKNERIGLRPLNSSKLGVLRNAAQTEMDSLYSEELNQFHEIDIIGHDENANRYHILGKDADGRCWLYRISAYSGIVVRTAFDSQLAAQIAARREGQVIWAHDATSMLVKVSGEYRYIDFTPEGLKPVSLASRYGPPVRLGLGLMTQEILRTLWQDSMAGALFIGGMLGAAGISVYRGKSIFSIAMETLTSLGGIFCALEVGIATISIVEVRANRKKILDTPLSSTSLVSAS